MAQFVSDPLGAVQLTAWNQPVSHTKVTQLLRQAGYTLQGNRKTEEAGDHPDRDAQFRHINRAVQNAWRAGEAVISVDTKKKELIGNYQNQGRRWRLKGTAEKVNGHDFPGPDVPAHIPTESMIWGVMLVSSMWERTTIPARSRWLRSVVGGAPRVAVCILERGDS